MATISFQKNFKASKESEKELVKMFTATKQIKNIVNKKYKVTIK